MLGNAVYFESPKQNKKGARELMFPNGEHSFLAQRTLDRNQVLPTASEVELLAYLLSAEQSLENTMGDSTLLVLQQEAIPLSSQPDVSRKQASFRGT